ncbi:hypothetical protein RA2_01483 [Roseovarius sp. A-2]|nr:hypothetical protein RA2_01483 [Roseovarius sp. A-2]
MAAVILGVVIFTAVSWRALVISTFDEGFARSMGLPVQAH